MKERFLASVAILAALATVAGAQDTAHQCPIDWVGRNAEVEELLTNADVVSVEDVGMGVTKPSKVILEKDGVQFAAAFKPIKRGRQGGFWESYEAEIAAYTLDRILGLNMVPPTVERSINKSTGSLQYWVNDCRLYKEVQDQPPQRPVEWSHQLSTMKMFDVLIMNKDRNAQNFLVDSGWHIVLIDHSRAFISDKNIKKDKSKLPAQFDRKIVEKLRALDQPSLEAAMGEHLMGGQVKSIIERRDELIKYLDELVAKQGEASVLFD
ncbi:MAG TPA: hypothetical protein VEK15_11420 [Vicinamibacteria bacterium]|nr:hypothetical protein [Vicinamibacteria bacterium]